MKTTKQLVYDKCSDTIRQQPENYCMAIRTLGRWRLDLDCASCEVLGVGLALALYNHQCRYGTSETVIKYALEAIETVEWV